MDSKDSKQVVQDMNTDIGVGGLQIQVKPQRKRRGDRRAAQKLQQAVVPVPLEKKELIQRPDISSQWISPDLNTPNWEYLDHTADVQYHSWGRTLQEALEGQAYALFNYMTPLEYVEVDERREPITLTIEGHDMQSLLFNYLQECLYVFCGDEMVYIYILRFFISPQSFIACVNTIYTQVGLHVHIQTLTHSPIVCLHPNCIYIDSNIFSSI